MIVSGNTPVLPPVPTSLRTGAGAPEDGPRFASLLGRHQTPPPVTCDAPPTDAAPEADDETPEAPEAPRLARPRTLTRPVPRQGVPTAEPREAVQPEGDTESAEAASDAASELRSTAPNAEPSLAPWLPPAPGPTPPPASGTSGGAAADVAAGDAAASEATADLPIETNTVAGGNAKPGTGLAPRAGLVDDAAADAAKTEAATLAGASFAAQLEAQTSGLAAETPQRHAVEAVAAPGAAPPSTNPAAATAPPVPGQNAANPVTLALPTPANAPEFPQALGVQVSVLARDGVQHAELHLNPAETGPVSVQIVLDGTQARVDFGADLAATRQAIEAGLPELAAALREAGLTLAGGGVSQHANGRDGSSERGDSSSRRAHASDHAPVDTLERPVRLSGRAGGIDLFA